VVLVHLPRTGGSAVQYHLELRVGKRNVARIHQLTDLSGRLSELRSTRVVVGHVCYPITTLLPSHLVATVVRDPVERAISVWEYLQWQTDRPAHRRLRSSGVRTVEEFATEPSLAGHIRENQTRLLGADCDAEAILAAVQAGDMDHSEANRLVAEATRRPPDASTLERAKRRLERMPVVGLTEELDSFVRRVERAMGLPPGRAVRRHNATPLDTVDRRPDEYSEDTRRRLAELNRFDSELHAFARELLALEEPTPRAS
jgi:hypothetical protein